MALGGVDLNLLIILQALLEEGNVTRAGLRVGMPQPAMSTALARLRRHYKDELLIRAGNGYTLTPLARSLLPEVQESTRFIGTAFFPATMHQPPGDGRTFTICLSNYSTAVIGRLLMRRINDLAPTVSVEMLPIAAGLPDPDRSPLQYDLLIASRGFLGEVAGGEVFEVVCRDRFVYIADPVNPRLRDGQLSLMDLAALPHAAIRLPHPDADAVVAVLRGLGIRPEIAITTADWMPLAFVIAGTDLVAAMPERLARQVCSVAGVTVVEPPFERVEFVESAWWHPQHATDPGLTWLRSVLAEVAASLSVSALPGQRQPKGAA